MTFTTMKIEIHASNLDVAKRKAEGIARGIYKTLRTRYSISEGLRYDYYNVKYDKTVYRASKKRRLGLYNFTLSFHR